MMDKIAIALLIIGGIAWGCVGLFQFDPVAWIFGGQAELISRIIYTVLGVSAVWGITVLVKEIEPIREV